MKKLYMQCDEIISLLSILFILLMAIFVDLKFVEIGIFFIILQLVDGNAKRIKDKNNLYIFIRRTIYFFPLILPVALKTDLSISFDSQFIALGIVLGIIYNIPQLSNIKFMLNKDFIQFSTEDISKFELSMDIYSTMGAAIFEELFFRYYILSFSKTYRISLVLLSCVLFLSAHASTKWNERFKIYDYLVQFSFSCLSCFLYILSRSILPSIIMHLFYNGPTILYNVKSLKIKGELK
ncbi:hypothetical protein Aargi30884_17390 [Amedibacterium intestinale]|uniref:CAAX prenyl protease 2/Lysostaphin resistance protein A-like domain-containing protein n=1 Tax=Amedibacterium intestinale TaxID=2583452 RepID=A0A6N4THZ3_9FIRM|nr:CPBP family intramembrane glutamic endopeptidase [Amedibacterium intestinale]BBK22836.1 hypothetical protein Aargi30884_17390 [Amedibacterium intestinale]